MRLSPRRVGESDSGDRAFLAGGIKAQGSWPASTCVLQPFSGLGHMELHTQDCGCAQHVSCSQRRASEWNDGNERAGVLAERGDRWAP